VVIIVRILTSLSSSSSSSSLSLSSSFILYISAVVLQRPADAREEISTGGAHTLSKTHSSAVAAAAEGRCRPLPRALPSGNIWRSTTPAR